MSVSGKRRCQTGHHVTKPATIDGVEGETCKRCGDFLLTLEIPTFTRRDVARWFNVPTRLLKPTRRMTRL